MSILEQEDKLESLIKARNAFLTGVKQECNLNDEDYNDLDVIETRSFPEILSLNGLSTVILHISVI